MGEHLRKFSEREPVRYLFFGGLTTGVNFIVFAFFRYIRRTSVNAANLASIAAAVFFAFFVNRFWVFKITDTDRKKMAAEFLNFAGMRMGTLGIEFFGVWFLIEYTGIPDFWSKGLIQAVVIIFNYVISKFIIFRKNNIGGVADEKDKCCNSVF